MIQRIQSVYLGLIMILSLLLFSGSVAIFTSPSGNTAVLTTSGNLFETGGKLISQLTGPWLIVSMLLLISVLSLVSLLMFRNRMIQIKVTLTVIFLSLILIAVCSWLILSVIRDFNMALKPGIKMAFPVLMLVFSILAYLGIRKDERLVKSYDRLR